jgi:hypothetical protein
MLVKALAPKLANPLSFPNDFSLCVDAGDKKTNTIKASVYLTELGSVANATGDLQLGAHAHMSVQMADGSTYTPPGE